MTYQQALAFIGDTQKYGSKPGLERIAALLDVMGNPCEKTKFIHITGTNGKGSTAAMTESILRTAGYKTGLYTSPYLHDFRERIQVMGQMITEEELSVLTEEAAAAIEQAVAKGAQPPTEFELITAMAFRYFAHKNCDVVVLEVGMGGTNDATNVIKDCEVAVFNPISLDHTEIMGERIMQIAQEKSGIIKPCCHAVCCTRQHEIAYELILARCGEMHVPLYIPNEGALEVVHADLRGSHIVYQGESYFIPLVGAHQIQNALTVLELVSALRKRDWEISTNAVVGGLKNTRWRGRLEQVRSTPLCLIDGAHNPDSVGVLCDTIDTMLQDRKVHIIMGMLENKDYQTCIPLLAGKAASFIATQLPNLPTSLPAAEAARTAQPHCADVYTHESIQDAVDCALSIAGKEDVILATGSLHMIGHAGQHLADS